MGSLLFPWQFFDKLQPRGTPRGFFCYAALSICGRLAISACGMIHGVGLTVSAVEGLYRRCIDEK